MKNAQRLTALIALTLIALAANTATATEGVSPGALDRLAVVETRCPTFSWGAEYGAQAYEIVGYSLSEESDREVELSSENEVLYTRVTGSAAAWTPSADQCFAPGGRYVWFVRAVTELIDDQVIEAGEWSTGRYFQVPAGPSAEDVARAVEVLKQWEAANGSGSLLLSSAAASVPVPVAAPDADSGSGSSHPKSVPTAAAAIRGEHPDASGEKYGVVGTSASADGAGLAAANLDGGPDLVLDGSADGETDTVLWQGGVDRESASHQTFAMGNSGAGRLNVSVDGDLTSEVVRTEQVVVNGLTVVDDSGDWLGNGSTVPCPGCVTSSDIADGSIIDNDLADDAVTEEKIEPGAVGTTSLQSNSVTSVKIADGGVATADLADDSVTGAKIADGAVGESNLRSNAVTTGKIAAATITGADIDPASWVYVSKSQLYEREESVSLVGSGGLSATAYCDDANDLPIAASCRVQSAALRLYGENAVDWTSAVDPAGWTCDFFNDLGGTHLGTAKILCISVP